MILSYPGKEMSARRSRVAVTISIPPTIAKEYDRLARATAKNRSELFRDMFDAYRRARDEEQFGELQRYGSRKARERGIRTERDVEKLVFEDR
jgi:metal-responsive CopG/Arc/MetJ family transcriptional regulator